jgi:hypothetical protein
MPTDSKLAEAQARLSAAEARKRRAALGPPLQQSDADLDALSDVGPHDLGAAEALIRDAGGAFGVALFRAQRG